MPQKFWRESVHTSWRSIRRKLKTCPKIQTKFKSGCQNDSPYWMQTRIENKNRELVRPLGDVLRFQNHLQSSCSISFVVAPAHDSCFSMRHFGGSLDQKLNLPQIEVESPPSADLITKNLKSDCLLTFSVVKVCVCSCYKNYTGAVLSSGRIVFSKS